MYFFHYFHLEKHFQFSLYTYSESWMLNSSNRLSTPCTNYRPYVVSLTYISKKYNSFKNTILFPILVFPPFILLHRLVSNLQKERINQQLCTIFFLLENNIIYANILHACDGRTSFLQLRRRVCSSYYSCARVTFFQKEKPVLSVAICLNWSASHVQVNWQISSSNLH